MNESAKYFDGSSLLHQTLRELRQRLENLGVPYAVVGGMALTAHGYARMTEDIHILITPADLKRLHNELVGRGYMREFEGAKNLRDTTTRVKIEFVLAGGYPGSGDKQPVSFPDPSMLQSVQVDGIKFVALAQLIELKLASGMTGGPDRAKDFVDVQQLVKTRHLERTLELELNEHVRAKYTELWDGLRATTKRFIRRWPKELLTTDARSLPEELRNMLADGVELERKRGYARLVTTSPEVAAKYDMHEESEFFDDAEDE
jgi:hypothetical protein